MVWSKVGAWAVVLFGAAACLIVYVSYGGSSPRNGLRISGKGLEGSWRKLSDHNAGHTAAHTDHDAVDHVDHSPAPAPPAPAPAAHVDHTPGTGMHSAATPAAPAPAAPATPALAPAPAPPAAATPAATAGHDACGATTLTNWDYSSDSQKCWAHIPDTQCGGEEQSPVNLVPAAAHTAAGTVPGLKNISFKAANGLEVINNGNFGTPTILGAEFQAVRIDTHAPAVHTVDGVRPKAEIHIVHKRQDAPEDYFIIALLFEIGDESALLRKMGLSGAFDLQDYIRNIVTGDYWNYKGSLMAPPCNETVNWVVFKEKLTATQAQVDLLTVPYREVQEMNKRSLHLNKIDDRCQEECTDGHCHWEYGDPSCWGKFRKSRDVGADLEYPSCTGKHQSPVNIVSADFAQRGADSLASARHYNVVDGLYVKNNGHSLQVDSSHPIGFLVVDGQYYHVKQFHWHFPSEHARDGVLHEGELHVVHQLHGATGTNGLLVVGIPYNIGADSPMMQQIGVRRATNDLQNVVGEIAVPEYGGGFFRYDGSLTTPPCSQTVKWFLVETPLEVSQVQIDAFKKLFPDPANNRPLQPLNDRTVVRDMFMMDNFQATCAAPGHVEGFGVADGHETDGFHHTQAGHETAGHDTHSDHTDGGHSDGGHRRLTEVHRAEGGNAHAEAEGQDGHAAGHPGEEHGMGYIDAFSYFPDTRCWVFNHAQCGGASQSPINIDTSALAQVGDPSGREHSFAGTLNYKPVHNMLVENNGKTLTADADFGYVVVSGTRYDLKGLDIHMPSEHAIDNKLHPGEMQLVHQRNGMNGDAELLIASIFFELGAESTLLRQLGLPGKIPASGGHQAANGTIHLQRALGKALEGAYFRYSGSMTTPPCAEAVKWFIFETPMTMSAAQHSDFMAHFGLHNRPLQEMGARGVAKNYEDYPGPQFMGYDEHPFYQNTPSEYLILVPVIGTALFTIAAMCASMVREDRVRKRQSAGGVVAEKGYTHTPSSATGYNQM